MRFVRILRTLSRGIDLCQQVRLFLEVIFREIRVMLRNLPFNTGLAEEGHLGWVKSDSNFMPIQAKGSVSVTVENVTINICI
jgi:hypothetical protein